MTDEEALANALSDPDAPPMTDEQLAILQRTPLSKRVRRRLGLTQSQFSQRYKIPIGTIRDWEQGRNEPDAAATALLRIIADYPEEAAKSLADDAA